MISLIDIVNLCIATIGLTTGVMGLLLTIRSQFMRAWIKQYFILVFGVITAYVVSDLISQTSLVFLGPEFAVLSKAAIFFESFFSSLLMPFLTLYMLRITGKGIRTNFFYTIAALWGLYFLLLLVTQFTTGIYYVTSDNVYGRGAYYPVLLIPAVLLMVINLFYLYQNKKLISKKELASLRLYLLIPLITMVIQMFSYGILLVVLGTTVSAMIMFTYIMNDQIDKVINQTIKISEQKLTIMTLQMRPHFIYNTLSNIYYLCDIDPEKAKAVIGDFTTYLQKNFHAITKEEPIPFEEELVHTKAFLAVAQVRFEDMIFVEYDTDYVSFRIPPLTLEPIVENAVKHGLDPEADALHIFIRTVREKNCIKIIVENDGVSYVAEEKNGSADNDLKAALEADNKGIDHIGLLNVRNRVKNMCNGSLEICERDGGGTVVTITVPKE